MRSLPEVMAEVGIDANSDLDLTPDEVWRRVNTEGSKSKNGAYIVRRSTRGTGVMVSVVNHSTGCHASWWSDSCLEPTYDAKPSETIAR